MPENNQDSGEKTEEPTTKRKEDARKEGNVAQSTEIPNALALLFMVLIFRLMGPHIMDGLTTNTAFSFARLDYEINEASIYNLFKDNIVFYLRLVLPVALTLMLVGVMGTIFQIGFLFSPKSLKPKYDSIKKIFSPAESLKQFFSGEAFQKLIKSIVKIFLISLIVYFSLKKDFAMILNYVDMDVATIFTHTANLTLKLLLNVFFFYAVVAIMDLMYTRWQYNEKMKMSKSEIKDEFRQMEGDPNIRGKIRNLMLSQSMKRMMDDVPESDVVITNPIHIAVALRYNLDKDEAPLILAMGKRKIAEKIKKIARENNIPVVEEPPLARLLYKTGKIGSHIAVDLYQAVAKILARVYQSSHKE